MNKIMLLNNELVFIDDLFKVINLSNEDAKDDIEIIFCVPNKYGDKNIVLFKAKIKDVNELPQDILLMQFSVPYLALFATTILHKNFRVVYLLFNNEFFKRRLER